jgi:predicted phosphoadenosine phosphosulfate sulfurtransferase
MIMGGKVYSDRNVYETTKDRLRTVFGTFKTVCVAFSGGKDSTVLLHLAVEVAREMGRLPVRAMFLDLEGQFRCTIEHVTEMFSRPEIIAHWICLPLNLRNASSASHPYWCAWEPGREAEWVRPMPEHSTVISDQAFFPFYKYRMEFEEFVPAYNEWMSQDEPMASVVGIRADESLNRYKAVKKRATIKKRAWNNITWSAKDSAKSRGVSFFPIYDWRFEDLWRYIHDHGFAYNRLYDWMYLTGMPFAEMRICQPYGDDQRKGLDLFHKIEPETWSRIVQRVEGANYAALYARQKFLGYKGGIGLPPSFPTWQRYVEFLMGTLPGGLKAVYQRRLDVFIGWWSENGCTLAEWPDAGDPSLENKKAQPSWRRVAVSILKQDMGKSLSFGFARKDTDRLIEIKARYEDL